MKAGAGIGEAGDPMFSLQAGAQHAIALPEVAWALQERDAKGADSSTKEGHLIPVLAFDCKATEVNPSPELAPTLRGMQHEDGNANGGGHAAICFDTVNVTSWANRTRCEPGGPAPTMHGFGEPLTVAFEPRFARNDRGAPDAVVPPLKAESGTTGQGDGAPHVMTGVMVRRLTPTECERLQGFGDGWTLIPLRNRRGELTGKFAKDGPRYRALGNSMAVPVIRWIGAQLAAATGERAD